MLNALALSAVLFAGTAHAEEVRGVEVVSVMVNVGIDGRPRRLLVRMRSGRRYVDNELWCGGLGVEKLEGQFEVCLQGSRGQEICTDLNALLEDPIHAYINGKAMPEYGDIWFPVRSWKIEVADYDHDGRPDFNLGIYGGCRGWGYTLLTVQPSGKVTRLVEDRFFLKGSFDPSVLFQVTPTRSGFRCSSSSDSVDKTGGWDYLEYESDGPGKPLRRASAPTGLCEP